MKKYFIKVFGCAMNVADTERIAGWYEARGYRRTEKPREANEVVIVTCSVRQTAEDRVYGLINNLAKYKIPALPAGRQNTKYKIILTGCMLRYPLKYLKEKLPNVDEFVKISNFKIQICTNILQKFVRWSPLWRVAIIFALTVLFLMPEVGKFQDHLRRLCVRWRG